MEQENYLVEYTGSPRSALISHIFHLGLRSIHHYREWCQRHDFSSQEKSVNDLWKEFQFYQESQAQKVCDEKKLIDFKDAVKRIYERSLAYEDIYHPALQTIYDGFEKSDWAEETLNFFLYLQRHSKLLKDGEYAKAVVALLSYRSKWVRSFEGWKPKSHSLKKQFSGLAQHLLARYPVPAFMENVFFQENCLHQEWFIHLGIGQNISTASGLPLKLNKKMAHHFLLAPEKYSAEDAFIWGQIRALGGEASLVETLRSTKAMRDFARNDFWLTVFRFFIQFSNISKEQIGPIIDYIIEHKFEPRRVYTSLHGFVDEPPLQPDFTMKGRTGASLIREVEKWHEDLGKRRVGAKIKWPHSSEINDFEFHEEDEKNGEPRLWTIRQLLTNWELFEEGRILKHCVASYVKYCVNNLSTIWTVEREDNYGRKKLLTIEVLSGRKQINQIRGKKNRFAKKQEISIIQRWCQQEEIESPFSV